MSSSIRPPLGATNGSSFTRKADAIRFLEDSGKAWDKAPYNLRARIWKRRNLIELVGQRAPGFRSEDHVGAAFSGLDALRGRAVGKPFRHDAAGCHLLEAVIANRAGLSSELDLRLTFVQQIHGRRVIASPEETDETAELPEADGQATGARGIGLAMLAADCLST